MSNVVKVGARELLPAALAGAVAFAAYVPALGLPFMMSWDDPILVTDNPYVQTLDAANLRWMATGVAAMNWMPLTYLSYALDRALFGPEPFGHHLTNVLLHAVCAALVTVLATSILTLAKRPAPWFAGLVAGLLFAVHPQHVESVAWISERKDVLCACFYLAATIAHLRGARLAVFAFALFGALAKPMIVSLPIALLILDLWPLRRPMSAALLVEKIPLLAVSSAVSLLTYQLVEVPPAPFEPLGSLFNAAHSVWLYFRLWLFPDDLSPVYPRSGTTLAPLFVGAVTVAVLWVWRRKGDASLLAGWLFILATLAPVLGLVRMSDAGAADRYTYVPLVPLFILAGAFSGAAFERSRVWAALPVCLAAALSVRTVEQTSLWGDDIRLWRSAVELHPRFAHARQNLAFAHWLRGEREETLEQLDLALGLEPENRRVHRALAEVQDSLGDEERALEHYRRVGELPPPDAAAAAEAAQAFRRHGRIEEAERFARRAMEIDPGRSDTRLIMAQIHAAKGEVSDAERVLVALVNDDPEMIAPRLFLALLYAEHQQPSQARLHLEVVLALDPSNTSARDALSKLP